MQNPATTGDPGPGGSCRVCGSKLDESLRCRQCGAAYGEGNRCPHCRAVTDVEPHAKLRFRCRVCGAPRVPLDAPEVVRTGRERPLLAQAERARMRGAAWKVGAVSVGAFGVFSLLIALVALALVSPGLLATLLTLLVVAVPFVFAALAWSRARQQGAQLERSLDDAWTLVASDLIRQRGSEATAADVAAAMRVSEEQADELLARLNVQDFVQARVTDEGDIAYSTRDLPLARTRVGDAGDAGEEEPLADEQPPAKAEVEQRLVIPDRQR